MRHDSITNRVSSPVKFGEYLQAGLKILISNHIGDYSRLVQENKLGLVIKKINQRVNFNRINFNERNSQIKYFKQHFEGSTT